MPVFIIFITIAVFICIGALPFIWNNVGWCYALVMRCCCKVNTDTSYSVNQADSRVQPQPLGLMGLKPEERQKIFERILVGKPYVASGTESEGAAAIPDSGAVSHSVEQPDDVEMGKTDDIAVGETVSTVDDETDLKHQEQNALSCAICLSEYVDGDIVISGTSCSHLFHGSCVFEWLAKKDHCPYCRGVMVTPSQMRTAVEEILGQERVRELWSHGRF